MQQNSSGQERDLDTLDTRLSAYYGPALRERPLAASAWHNLQSQLGPQQAAKHSLQWHMREVTSRIGIRHARRRQQSVPSSIRDALEHIVHEAHSSIQPSKLQCTFSKRRYESVVRVSPFWWPIIRLILSSTTWLLLEQDALNVLLATGLARYLVARRRLYLLTHIAFSLVILVSIATLSLLWKHQLLSLGLLIAVSLCASAVMMLGRYKKAMALSADRLVVRWLGRNRVCHGLHVLANRSRRPDRKSWGEPSLAERIQHVCGTRVEARERNLTLVG